jgi:NADH-quinone oxidoreductase subunit E/NADP-reducing hydrogenase subunit HndA
MSSIQALENSISRLGHQVGPGEKIKFDQLEIAMGFYNRSPEALIQILHRAQELFGYLRPDVVEYVAQTLRLPASQVYGVISFYSFFSTVPRGKYTIMACMGTACYVRGAEQVVQAFEKELNIQRGQTTPDGLFSLKCVRCLGACGMAPVVMIGEDVHSKLRADGVKKVIRQYS